MAISKFKVTFNETDTVSDFFRKASIDADMNPEKYGNVIMIISSTDLKEVDAFCPTGSPTIVALGLVEVLRQDIIDSSSYMEEV